MNFYTANDIETIKIYAKMYYIVVNNIIEEYHLTAGL
jgi:hypothetical protein